MMGKKKILISIVIAIALVGAAAYAYYSSNSDKQASSNPSSETKSSDTKSSDTSSDSSNDSDKDKSDEKQDANSNNNDNEKSKDEKSKVGTSNSGKNPGTLTGSNKTGKRASNKRRTTPGHSTPRVPGNTHKPTPSVPKPQPEMPKPNPKPDLPKPKPEPKPNPNPPVQEEGLADGTWYGTGSEAFYYSANGPDVVRITVKNGKITEAENVVYQEDPEWKTRGFNIFKATVKQGSIDGFEKQLKDRKGEMYDTVSTATETAKSQLSAMKNAVERSKKFKRDRMEQKISYLEFVKKPNPRQTGSTLDLSGTVIKIHFSDGTSKEVSYDKLHEYDITVSPQHGSQLPEVGKHFLIHFKNAGSMVDIPASAQVQKIAKYRTATKIVVTYEDNSTQEISLNDKNFRYDFKAIKKVKKMEIYSGNDLLREGTYNNELKVWEFDLRIVSVGNGYDAWKYSYYSVKVEQGEDNSPITRFRLYPENMKREYTVGETLDLSKIYIYATRQSGNNVSIGSWEECKKLGFTSSPDAGYKFTEEDAKTNNGLKTINISIKNGSETITHSFDIKVNPKNENPAANQTPAKVSIFDGDTKIKDVTMPASFNGYASFTQIEIPKKYTGKLKDLKVKVYNKNGEELESKITKATNTFIRISLPKFPGEDGGTINLGFKFV